MPEQGPLCAGDSGSALGIWPLGVASATGVRGCGVVTGFGGGKSHWRKLPVARRGGGTAGRWEGSRIRRGRYGVGRRVWRRTLRGGSGDGGRPAGARRSKPRGGSSISRFTNGFDHRQGRRQWVGGRRGHGSRGIVERRCEFFSLLGKPGERSSSYHLGEDAGPCEWQQRQQRSRTFGTAGMKGE